MLHYGKCQIVIFGGYIGFGLLAPDDINPTNKENQESYKDRHLLADVCVKGIVAHFGVT